MIFRVEGQPIEFIEGVSSIIDRYDGFLCDIWGVLHDGSRLYPDVRDCLFRLKQHQKKIILLSNSARLAPEIKKQTARLGLSPDLYDHILSSGELTREAFLMRSDSRIAGLGRNYYLFGPEHYTLAGGIGICRVTDLADADFVFVIGVTGNPASTQEMEPALGQAASRGLPMVCANPDIHVARGGTLGIGPGALAAYYEGLGGNVIYWGKPHREIYRKCVELLSMDAGRAVAVGDSLRTDIAGASAYGLDSILVSSGIHARELAGIPDDRSNLSALLAAERVFPTMIARGLKW